MIANDLDDDDDTKEDGDNNDNNNDNNNHDDVEDLIGMFGLDPTHLLFRKLLREVVAGSATGVRQMQFPQHFIQPSQSLWWTNHDNDDDNDDKNNKNDNKKKKDNKIKNKATKTKTTTHSQTLEPPQSQQTQPPPPPPFPDSLFRLRRMIQREFRAKSLVVAPKPKTTTKATRAAAEAEATASASSTKSISTDQPPPSTKSPPPPPQKAMSVAFSDTVRRRVAFWALRRLNEKLAWHDELLAKQQQQQQQVRRTPRPSSQPLLVEPPESPPPHTQHQQPPKQGRRVVAPLPWRPASSYLQPGTFLIAHPNLTGYFRRSVICILDDFHFRKNTRKNRKNSRDGKNKTTKSSSQAAEVTSTPEGNDDDEEEEEEEELPFNNDQEKDGEEDEVDDDDNEDVLDNDDDDDVDDDDLDDEFPSTAPSYGTYGVVVNRLAYSRSSGLPITLQETYTKLPRDFEKAFGDSVVRDGGPVQGSLQMMHSMTLQQQEQQQLEEEQQQQGGSKLKGIPLTMAMDPRDVNDDDDDDDDDDDENKAKSKVIIKFRGDIVQAAKMVVKQRLSSENFAFFVGCSSWAPGQLESEMERGIWLPVRAPPEVAFSGHFSIPDDNDKDDDDHDRTHIINVVNNNKDDDLWLSLLSACGEEEAKLAKLLSHDDGEHEFGGQCDAFDD
ncbi:hypothetical protein ACA910_011829 [Epithemia clementina (nom. ined.)]